MEKSKLKGSILLDSIFIGFAIVLLICVCLFMYVLLTNSKPYAVAAGLNGTFFDKGLEALTIFDYNMILIVLGLFMSVIISAFFIQSHPLFFVVSLLTLTIVIAFSAIPANLLEAMIADTSLTAAANSFPISITIMRNWPIIVLVFSIIAIIVLHMRKGGGLIQE